MVEAMFRRTVNLAGRIDRARSSGMEVHLALIHLSSLELHGNMLNPEETHRIMSVL
jgi:hypothetical protein